MHHKYAQMAVQHTLTQFSECAGEEIYSSYLDRRETGGRVWTAVDCNRQPVYRTDGRDAGSRVAVPKAIRCLLHPELRNLTEA
jgi:hypothetical protein